MERAYIWWPSEKYQEYEGTEQMLYFNKMLGAPLPPIEEWKPPTLQPFFPEEAKSRKVKASADFMRCGNPYIISERALSSLAGVFEANGLLYPLTLEGSKQKYFMFVCHNIVDCLDLGKSKVKRSVVNPSIITTVLEPAFRNERLKGQHVFAVPEVPHFLYMTELMKNLVADAKLKEL